MILDIQKYAGQLADVVVAFAPKLVAALVILIVAYIVAKLLAWIVSYGVNKTGIGQRAAANGTSIGASLAKAVFWVVMLIAMPGILGALGMQSIAAPLQDMAQKFLAFLPNLFGAGIILLVGSIVATVARTAITSVLEAAQIDSWAERAGVGAIGVAKAIGTLAFALIIVPVAIASLDALQMASIADPAKAMLTSFLGALPNIIGAGIILALSFVIARFASGTMATVLPATGIDKVGANPTVQAFIGKNRSLSGLLSQLVFVAIAVFGLIEAAKMLQFAVLSTILAEVLTLGGKILLGSVIIAFGVFAANIVADIVAGTTAKASAMPGLIRVVIILLATAMGLRQMGIADEIVTLAFTMLIGSIALGSAIAIGFGGQDTAKTLLAKWTKKL